jgi:LysM repeat protein
VWGPSAGSEPVPGLPLGDPDQANDARTVTCPFLRLEAGGALVTASAAPSEAHRCVAIDGPRVLSPQQQEFVCLRSAHVDCPRYRRAIAPPRSASVGPIRTPAIPRAVVVSLAVLAVSAGVSFGFVAQRGGIDLPSAAPSEIAAAGTAASGTSSPATAGSSSLTPQPTPSPTVSPTIETTPSPEPTQVPNVTAPPTASPAPSPSASGGPSASRLAVLKPCANQPDCYVYTVRSGDNLVSIAHWFGVPLATIYAWNPPARHGIRPSDQLKIPTPTR